MVREPRADEADPEDASASFDALTKSPARIGRLITRLVFRERSIASALEKPESLSVGMLASLTDVETWQQLLRLEEDLERESESFSPPPLWMAWFERVHRGTVERLARELREFRVARPPYRGCTYISYAREDIHAAESIAVQLKEAGLIVWFDQWVAFGTNWESSALRIIEHDASAFLSLISENTAGRSGHYIAERNAAAARAFGSDVPFYIPVRIDDGEPLVASNEPPGVDRFRGVRLESGRLPAALVDDLRRRQLSRAQA